MLPYQTDSSAPDPAFLDLGPSRRSDLLLLVLLLPLLLIAAEVANTNAAATRCRVNISRKLIQKPE